MSAESGRVIDPIDLGTFGQELEAPISAALVDELRLALVDIHRDVDGAHSVLHAETARDVTGDDVDELPDVDELEAPIADDDRALGSYLEAQAGYAEVRADIATFTTLFPADMVPGEHVYDRRNPPPGNRQPGRPPHSSPV